jgi:hypothetical protein
MAGSKSDYLEAKLLDHVLGATTYTPPATVYIALFTVSPSDSGGGTEVSTSGTAYARVAVTNNTTNWPNASGTSPTSKSNGTTFTFPTATADWGTIVAMAIFDASTSGNMLYWATLNASKLVSNGDTASFSNSTITVTED